MHWREPDPDLLPPATLTEARALRDAISRLLAAERTAAAALLDALADFDARRGWEPLGHASLFGFLHAELGLSKGAAFLRFTAVRLVRRFPEVAEALRSGRLCLSAVGELARVMTPENRAEVLPQFFGCSSREARLVAAALVPRESPPTRELVTRLPLVSRQRPLPAHGEAEGASPGDAPRRSAGGPDAEGAGAPAGAPAGGSPGPRAGVVMLASGERAIELPVRAEVRAHELAPTRPAWVPSGPECEPLDADLRRLHLTVTRGLLAKLEAARQGLKHILPGATTEQVLEAALDLLLEKQGGTLRRVRQPRRTQRPARKPAASMSEARTNAEATSFVESRAGVRTGPGTEAQAGAQAASRTACQAELKAEARTDARTAFQAEAGTGPRAGSPGTPREAVQRSRPGFAQPEDQPRGRGGRAARAIPAAVEREVRSRDGGRCQFPLDAGGICGSTTCLQLDHVVPLALGGQSTVENLRLLCAPHNRYAARLALGEGVMATARRRKRRTVSAGEGGGDAREPVDARRYSRGRVGPRG